MEYYITPRNVNYGYYDNGVFQFKLEKQSIKVPFEERTYACNIKKGSLFELFYLQEQTSNNRQSNLVSFEKIGKDSIWKPRMLIIASSHEHSDTLFVDTHLNGLYKGDGYRLDSKFITDLLAIMPIELKESWEKDLPSR